MPEFVAHAQNTPHTFRLEIRARLDRVDWHLGEDLLVSCEAAEMAAFMPDESDPIEDLPLCHHTFTELLSGDLVATLHYEIEERLRTREFSTEYPDSAWRPHPTDPTVALSTTVADYSVHQILAVNATTEYVAAYEEHLDSSDS